MKILLITFALIVGGVGFVDVRGVNTNQSHSLHFSSQSSDTIYTQVDVIPRFSGGRRGWSTFINKNLNVRQIQESIDEDAYISFGLVQQANLEFTVCEDGRVCDIDVLNEDKISPEFRDEVLRVMKRSPRWKPAEKDGKAVKTRFRQPVTVNLKN